MVASVDTVTQVLAVVMKYVPPEKIAPMLDELGTIKGNKSFIETVKLLQKFGQPKPNG